MNPKKQLQALKWMAAILIMFIAVLFSFSKYLYLRSAGESVGDSAFFMLLFFFGSLMIATIVYGTTRYFIWPEGIYAYHGLSLIHKQRRLISDEDTKRTQLKSQQDVTLQECIEYARVTFQNLLTDDEITNLADNIVKFSQAKTHYIPIDNESLASVTNVDLFHFGWNIGKRILPRGQRKLGIETTEFLKATFKVRLADIAEETISAKLTTTEGRFSLPKIDEKHELLPHIFPALKSVIG